MIRINLIERTRIRPGRSANVSLDWIEMGDSSPAMRIGLGLVAAGILWLGGHYFYLQHEATELQQRLTQAHAENQHLQTVQRAYNASLKKRQEIQNRLQIIQSLRNAGAGPTALMTAMGNSVNQTPGLWLTSVADKGEEIQIKGDALSMDGVANLMTELQKSGYFGQIELKDSNQSSAAKGQQHPYEFELVARPAAARS